MSIPVKLRYLSIFMLWMALGADTLWALPFYATYRTSAGGRVAFMLDGTVQSGGDVVHVNNLIAAPTFNGQAPSLTSPFLRSFSDYLFNDATVPTLSFSGDTHNFMWASETPGLDGIIFNDTKQTFLVQPSYAGGPSFGDVFEVFVADNWALRPVLTFHATYETSAGDTVSFVFDGVIEPDGDAVEVIRLRNPATFNGVNPGLADIFLRSFSDFLFDDSTYPTVSYTGDTMNLFWGTTTPTLDGIIFNDTKQTFLVQPSYAGGPSYGDVFESFDASRWTLTQHTAVPEPGVGLLVSMGVTSLLLRRRRYPAP